MATDVISHLHVVVHIMKGGKFFNSSENKHTQTIKKNQMKNHDILHYNNLNVRDFCILTIPCSNIFIASHTRRTVYTHTHIQTTTTIIFINRVIAKHTHVRCIVKEHFNCLIYKCKQLNRHDLNLTQQQK